MALFTRHLRAIFYFKQGIFYNFYPEETLFDSFLNNIPDHVAVNSKLKIISKVKKTQT